MGSLVVLMECKREQGGDLGAVDFFSKPPSMIKHFLIFGGKKKLFFDFAVGGGQLCTRVDV